MTSYPVPFSCPDFDYSAARPVTYDTQPDTSGTYPQCMSHCNTNYKKFKDGESHQLCATYCHMANSDDPYAFAQHLRKNE